jgi:hypothetical protein
VRVPSAAQTADSVDQAERVLTEIRAREADDRLEAEQERAAELARWHHDDQAEHEAVDEDGIDAEGDSSGDPVLER